MLKKYQIIKITGIFLFFVVTFLITAAGILYYINSQSMIYELNENTAQFLPFQQAPDGVISLKAKDCGVCHVEIYKEWQQTLHANAYHDPYFQAYLKKDKNDPTCLVCHTPLENQAEFILSAKKIPNTDSIATFTENKDFNQLTLVRNKNFDQQLQSEGVTCAVCHVKDQVIYGPYPKESMNAPHPVAYDKKFTSKSLCSACHQVPVKSFSLLNEGICSTGEESEHGPWSDAGAICQDCHMPEVNRPLMAGFPTRKGRQHEWPGGYSSTQLKKVFEFKAKTKNNRLYVSIKNSGAGHKVPTGDPERFIQLEFFWQPINKAQLLGKKKKIESIIFKRQLIWQPIMMQWSDNRLAPGENLELDWTLPAIKGQLLVKGTYYVMSQAS